MNRFILNKILFTTFISFLIVAFTSCNEYKQRQKACDKCMSKVAKKLDKDAPSNLDEAIAAYDFDAAHKYYACYEMNHYNAWETGKKLFRAEATYLLANGEIEKAESLAKEMEQTEIYNDLLAETIPSLIKSKKYNEVVDILASWPFQESYKTEVTNYYIGYINKVNGDYNDEMTKYNTIVDNLLAAAILDEDVAIIEKCIKLYGPLASVKKKVHQSGYASSNYDFQFELKNTYRDDAKKEVAAAGIKLK